MTDTVFLFGALQDPDLLSIVLGGPVPEGFPARLPGQRMVQAGVMQGATLMPTPGETVEGLCLPDVPLELMQRIRFYAQVIGFNEINVEVEAGPSACTAILFRADPPPQPEPWSDRDIQAERRIAADIMAYRDRYSAEELAARLPRIKARAAAWQSVRARSQPGAHDVARDVEVERHHRPYMNFYAVEEMDLRFRKQDGTMSETVNRGALILGEAVVVLPYDPRRDTVLLVEQFRAPVYIGGSRNPWIWEPVAGLIDPGETPEATALREAEEEAGVRPDRLVPVGPAYSSSGSTTDYLHLFIGLCDFDRRAPAVGLVSEGEDIRSRELSFDALMDDLDAGAFTDLPLIALGHWLARHRAKLRAMT